MINGNFGLQIIVDWVFHISVFDSRCSLQIYYRPEDCLFSAIIILFSCFLLFFLSFLFFSSFLSFLFSFYFLGTAKRGGMGRLRPLLDPRMIIPVYVASQRWLASTTLIVA